jgi:endonuclease-3
VKRADKARRIQELLDELYPEMEIPLRHRNPYTLLIAVVLSAQCTDERVNAVTPGPSRWLA